MSDKPTNLSRRAFVFGATTVAGAAVVGEALGAERVKICETQFNFSDGLHEKCWHETRDANGKTVEVEKEQDETKGGGEGKRGSSPSVTSSAYTYFAQIGLAIVEGRYNGKLDAIDIERPWKKDGKEGVDTFRIWLKDFNGQSFSRETYHAAKRCNDGVQQPLESFNKYFLATLGQKAYLAEETMPDKPTSWNPAEPYVQTMFVTSDYRHEKYNERCGGQPHSRHLHGFAMDVVSVGKANAKMVYGAAISNEGGQHRGGISYYSDNGFTHIDPDEPGEWEKHGVAFGLERKAAFKIFQLKHGITPFSLARNILQEPMIAQLPTEPPTIHAQLGGKSPLQNASYTPDKANIAASTQPSTSLKATQPKPPTVIKEIIDGLNPGTVRRVPEEVSRGVIGSMSTEAPTAKTLSTFTPR